MLVAVHNTVIYIVPLLESDSIAADRQLKVTGSLKCKKIKGGEGKKEKDKEG